jgi:hypothetical protein
MDTRGLKELVRKYASMSFRKRHESGAAQPSLGFFVQPIAPFSCPLAFSGPKHPDPKSCSFSGTKLSILAQ